MTTTLIRFPEEKRGELRATSYGVQGVVIYDDKSNPRQAVWNETDMERAVAAMELLHGALDGVEVLVTKDPIKVVDKVIALPKSLRPVALKIAKARGVWEPKYEWVQELLTP